MNREVILAGRPNSGKSTLFNRLATAQQKVANFAGCTVEKKTAFLRDVDTRVAITDLPGVYSFEANTKDEEVALNHLRESRESSQIVVVADGNNLEQELPFPLLLKKHGYDVIIAVNMMDEVDANRRILNLAGMSDLAGVPFFPVSAKKGIGVAQLKNFLVKHAQEPKQQGSQANASVCSDEPRKVREQARSIYRSNAKDPERDALFERSSRIDRFLVHPLLGPVVFLATMFLLFQSIFVWSGPLSDLIDEGIVLLQEGAKNLITHQLLASLVADGVLAGVGAVVVFVPQIALLFFLIGTLELSGYLPRAAYMVDRLLRPYGLEGKVFIPLLSSVACAVPGIMATRTIENERTRIITILISPLMTCSARLPVYTLLTATFVPAVSIGGFSARGLAMFAMYVLGVVTALVVALVIHYFGGSAKKASVDILALPNYRIPDWRTLYKYVWSRVWMFLRKAGTIIAAMAIVLWFLLTFPRDNTFRDSQASVMEQIAANTDLSSQEKAAKITEIENLIAAKDLENSAGGRIGKAMAPVFAPIGYDWRLTIGVLGSLAAREVFVSTLGTVFALGASDENSEPLTKLLLDTRDEQGKPRYTIATCFSLLIFFAFSLQCISTIGVARRESNSWKIPAVMFVYMFVLAYAGAFVVFHLTRTLAGV